MIYSLDVYLAVELLLCCYWLSLVCLLIAVGDARLAIGVSSVSKGVCNLCVEPCIRTLSSLLACLIYHCSSASLYLPLSLASSELDVSTN